MKAIILAGGYGTRIAEETGRIPKPMIQIGGKPILWHIMKIYSHFGIRDFIVCLGYKGYVIKEYFYNYAIHTSDVTFDLGRNRMEIHRQAAEDWRVTLVDTGEDTMTGGRLKHIRPYLDAEPFCMTYGDGLADIDIARLVAFHRAHGKLATVTAIRPPGRFGALEIRDNAVLTMREKPEGDGGFINGGFFVLVPQVLDRIADHHTVWEREPLESLARDGELMSFVHDGFWQPMDTLREKNLLNDLWHRGEAPWKMWS